MPDKYKGTNGIYNLHRDLGVGFYLQGYLPYKTVYEGIQVHKKIDNGIRVTRVDTPVGTIHEVWKYLPDSYAWGPQEHFLKDYNDLKVIRYWYEHTYYEPDYKLAKDRYELIGDNGVVLCYTPKSPLNEVSLHLKRSGFTEERIRNIILAMEKSCAVVDFTLDLLLSASELREKHQFSFWDSLIIACSIEADCKILYEDMQDGRGVRFRPPAPNKIFYSGIATYMLEIHIKAVLSNVAA